MNQQQTATQLILTRDNYYGGQADIDYMSCSQYQDFLDCEARAMAKIEGRFVREESEAFLVGNYFHTFFEGESEHKKWCEEHFDDVFKSKLDKKTGELIITGKYAPYTKADELIQTVMNDELCRAFVEMPGENEKIITGEIFGVPWKARLDKYLPDERIIIDYKTCKSIYETNYNPFTKQRETFIETYGYMMRAAIYSELEKQMTGQTTDPQFILICVSKEGPPDKEIVSLNHRERYDVELETVKQNLARIMQVKNHRTPPKKCGVCEYCRSIKKLSTIKPYYQLMPEFREERQPDEESNFYKIS